MHQGNNFGCKGCGNLTNKQLQTEQNEAKRHISFDVCQQEVSIRFAFYAKEIKDEGMSFLNYEKSFIS